MSTRFQQTPGLAAPTDSKLGEDFEFTATTTQKFQRWMYGVLVVLGWNEAMAVLFNPLYFTFLLCAVFSSLCSD